MKWSKKICVEYLTTMRDPLEEAAAQPQDKGQALLDRLMTAGAMQQMRQIRPQQMRVEGG